MISLILFIILSAGISNLAVAADLSRDLREGRQDPGVENGGFLQLGIGFTASDIPLEEANGLNISFEIGGRYYWNGFFIDLLTESYSGLQIGYNYYNSETLSLDVLGAFTEFSINDNVSKDLESLRERDSVHNYGLRATVYLGENLLQFELLKDFSGEHGGHVASIFAGRNWLVSNWNVHMLVGARYWSQKTLDYVVGVRPDEASVRFPVYVPDAGVSTAIEAGVTYPLSENWVFRGTLSHWNLSSGIEKSPFVTDDKYASAVANFIYVY